MMVKAPKPTFDSRGSNTAPVELTDWRDPDDKAAMERDALGRAHRKTVVGWRVIDPLARLPCSSEHLQAANRLRADWERGSGATGGGMDLGRVDQSGSRDTAQANQLLARRRYEGAVQAVGMRGCVMLLPVVLGGCTVSDLIRRLKLDQRVVQTRVMSALDRLVEHYGLGDRVQIDVWKPELVVDVMVTDIPQEQLGRVKK